MKGLLAIPSNDATFVDWRDLDTSFELASQARRSFHDVILPGFQTEGTKKKSKLKTTIFFVVQYIHFYKINWIKWISHYKLLQIFYFGLLSFFNFMQKAQSRFSNIKMDSCAYWCSIPFNEWMGSSFIQ